LPGVTTAGTLDRVSSPDYPRLIDELAELVDMINAGNAGLRALYRLLEIGRQALEVPGLLFVEYAPKGGRVIAATAALEWAVGRPMNTSEPVMARFLAGARVQELSIDDLPTELAAQLRGRGLCRSLSSLAELGGLVVGSLHAYFRDADGRATGAQRSIAGFLANSAAHLYGDGNGLPTHGDGPVVATLTEGLAILTAYNEVRLWNPAAERATGVRAADVLGGPVPLPVPAPGGSLDHRLPDGRWLQVSVADLPGTQSRVVTFRDTTDVRRRERDRDLFIAVTSHELRTPVTVIKGYADTLTVHWESLDEVARRDAVRVLGQRASELARLVDRLLTAASQANAGVSGTAPEPFELIDALREGIAGLPADLRRALRVRLPTSLAKAYGDRASVGIILTELVTNAVKYSADEVDVLLTAEADRQTVYFRVADRGIGVRPEHVERAFERFWQGEADDQRRYGGVGLGLYLVRRIVERQNGWVSLRPRERGGTVVEVRLPRADGAGEV